MKSLFFVLTAIIIYMQPGVGIANTYFVDKSHPAANDANNGSEAAPWRTIQKAANTLKPGDTVYVKQGVYTELFSGPPDSSITALKVVNSGTASNFITYRAYPGHMVILDQNHSGAGFFLSNKHYIKIIGFEIMNAISGGVWTLSGSSNIYIENNHIHHIDGPAGSNVGGAKVDDCGYCVIRNNYIHDITVAGVNKVFQNGANSAGVHSFGMHNVVIENNVFFNAYNGVYHKKSAGLKGALIKNNLIHDVIQGIWFSVQGAGSPPHIDQEVTGNIMHTVNIGVIANAHDASDINRGLNIWNNVISAKDVCISFDAFHDVSIYNNLFTGSITGEAIRGVKTNSSRPSSILYLDNNAYYNIQKFSLNLYSSDSKSYSSLSSWQAGTGYDIQSLLGDPGVISLASHDYRLLNTSSLQGKGRYGESIGAYPIGNEIIGLSRRSMPPTGLTVTFPSNLGP